MSWGLISFLILGFLSAFQFLSPNASSKKPVKYALVAMFVAAGVFQILGEQENKEESKASEIREKRMLEKVDKFEQNLDAKMETINSTTQRLITETNAGLESVNEVTMKFVSDVDLMEKSLVRSSQKLDSIYSELGKLDPDIFADSRPELELVWRPNFPLTKVNLAEQKNLKIRITISNRSLRQVNNLRIGFFQNINGTVKILKYWNGNSTNYTLDGNSVLVDELTIENQLSKTNESIEMQYTLNYTDSYTGRGYSETRFITITLKELEIEHQEFLRYSLPSLH